MSGRRVLPSRRKCETLELGARFRGCSVSTARFADGALAEIFINSDRPTGEVADVARDGAVLISIALQWGVPSDKMNKAITRLSDGSAASIIGAALDLVAGAGCHSADAP